MNIKILNKYKVIEWIQNYWKNAKLSTEYRITE